MLVVPSNLRWVALCAALWCLSLDSINGDCPIKGKSTKKVPDVLLLNKDQKGYTATVEIITPEEDSIMVTESYNGAKLVGSLEINWIDHERTRNIYYYQATKESYSIENGDCAESNLNVEDKYKIIDSWISPEAAKDEIDLFGSLDILGPTVLMTYAKSVSDIAQYVGSERIDGRTFDHWFHCLSDEINLDWWFELSTNLPYRFTLSSAKNLTRPHVYNFLVFTPVAHTVKDIVQYPFGYGCYRSVKGQPELPEFAINAMFSLDAEAMIMYNNPDKVLLSSLRMMKYQDTFSFEFSDGPNTTRVIQNPLHMGRYTINAETGECKSESLDYSDLKKDNLAATWPYHKDLGFNLLVAISSTSGIWSNYMGQVNTDAGVMDVWEDDFHSFFSGANYMDASITYYFPAIDLTKKPQRAPTKIVIKAHNKQYITMREPLPYQIEIVFIDYTESDLELSDRFDVSGCYDGPGEFTWFQIVMSDASSRSYAQDMTNIRVYFEQALATFIPIIRIPEIVVNLYDFNFYISVKLLERPPFKFHYSSNAEYEIKNPTSILIRDHLEDCGDICTNDINCKSFSYCNDFTCQIFSSALTYSLIQYNQNCTRYTKNNYEASESIIKRNVLASTRSILTQVKAKVNNGEFLLPKYGLSAEDMFIVSGPEEFGGIEEEFDDKVTPLKGDEYSVIASDSRLSSGEIVDSVPYSDCLKLCQNDDDCYSLSYCFNQHKECVLSTETKANLTKSLSDKTSHADSCNVFEKSFMAFYRKFPGQSLVKDAIATLPGIDESECARKCYESTDFPCRSFDFCTASEGSTKTDCFLHQFHAVEDTAHEITGTVWDFSKSACDHYAVRLSRDYTHYINRQYKQGSVTILKEIGDVGLERCAADCNSDEGNCVSFEYCESIANDRGSKVKSTCRLSSASGNTVSYASLESTSKTCSVYLNKAKANENQKLVKGSDHFGVAMGLGSFFFVVAFAAGIAGSIYYQRRFS